MISLGYEPVLAHGGRQAVQLLQTADPHLVLLDLIMRNMDGWTVLIIIQAAPNLSDIPCSLSAPRRRLSSLPEQ